MATYTISPGNVVHTLGRYSCGTNMDSYVYPDMANAFFRSLIVALAPEIIRCTSLNSSMNYAAWSYFREFFKHLQTQLGAAFGVMLFTGGMPVPLPGTPATSITASIQTANGYAPADHAALYEDWVNYGIDVRWWEWQNEAENMSFGLNSAPWFDPAVFGAAGAQTRCNDWCTIHHQAIAATYAAKIAALGRTAVTKIVGPEEFGVVKDAGYEYVRDFLSGAMRTSGQTNPNASPSNISSLGALTTHSYGGGEFGDDQGALNSYFYDSGGNEAAYLAGGGQSRYRTAFRLLRAILNANGGANIKFFITEGGGLTPNHVNALTDIAQAISFCQIAKDAGAEGLLVWAINRSDPPPPAPAITTEEFFLITDNGVNPTSEAAYLPGRRYYAFRDGWGYFMRNFKQQVQVVTNVAPGNTPASPNNNSVPRIQLVAHRNDAADKLSILLTNLDLSNTEQVTVNLGTTSAGAITGVRFPNPASHAPPPAITPFGTHVTGFTTGALGAPSLAAGDSFRFEVPLPTGQAPPFLNTTVSLH